MANEFSAFMKKVLSSKYHAYIFIIVTDKNKISNFCNRAQVVGWPPIRSFRKNTMASNLTKNNDGAEGKPGFGCLYVKVSMDGAPYLRKVDLKTYNNYVELSSALEKMFSCFTIGSNSTFFKMLPLAPLFLFILNLLNPKKIEI